MSALIPYLVAFAGVFSYAMMGPVAKKMGAEIQPFSFMAVSSLFLLVVAGSLAFLFERQNFSDSLSRLHWWWMGLYLLVNFLAYTGYLWAIARIPVAQFEMFGIFVPVVGGFFAWLILKEPFHPRYFVALAVMACGILIAIGPDLRGKN